MRKYPRTQHIRGSRFQNGDHDLESVPFKDLLGKHLVIEEKMDGANCGISFNKEGELLLQSRGHYLRGGPRERQFNLFKQWANTHVETLYCILGDRYIMYGEWLYAKHTYFYDALPHYFMEFDILDTEYDVFLDTRARARTITGTSKRGELPTMVDPVVPVLVLGEGTFNHLDDLQALLGKSRFISDDREKSFYQSILDEGIMVENQLVWAEQYTQLKKACDWSPLMEGLYIKWEEDGIVKGRYKFVRESFTNSILDQDEHWMNRPIIPNRLKPEVSIFG